MTPERKALLAESMAPTIAAIDGLAEWIDGLIREAVADRTEAAASLIERTVESIAMRSDTISHEKAKIGRELAALIRAMEEAE